MDSKMKMKGQKVVKKRDPIIIPGAEFMAPEELAKAKKNEGQRRLMARRRGGVPLERTTKQELRKLETGEMVELAKDTRNLAIQTLNTKLLDIYSDPEELKKVNLATLATVFGILFDKSQLMNGLATENIAIQAKIDVNLSSDEVMNELNRMRERYNE